MVALNLSNQIQIFGDYQLLPRRVQYTGGEYIDMMRATNKIIIGVDDIRSFYKSAISPDLIDRSYACSGKDLLMVSSPLEKCGVTEYTNHLLENMRISSKYCRWTDIKDGIVAGLYAPKVFHFQFHGAYMDADELACVTEFVDTTKVCTLHDIPTCIPILSKFDGIICHTEEDVRAVSQYTAYPGKIKCIPQGFLKQFSGTPKKSIGNPVVGFVGFMSLHKGLHKIVECAPEVIKKFGNVVFRVISSTQHSLAGEYASVYAENIHSVSRSIGVGDHFEWVHDHLSVEDMQSYIAGCDIIVLPYLFGSSGGSSAAVRMAMSAGVPVLGSSVPILRDMDKGFVRFDVDEISEERNNLHNHIINMLGSDLGKLRKDVASIVKKNSWSNIGKATEKFYAEVSKCS